MRHLLSESPKVVISVSNNQRTVREVNFAVIDVARNRERNLPKFNQLRRYLGMKPFTCIDELIPPSNLLDNHTLKALYKDDIEEVDVHIGLLAEEKMDKCAVGETTYAIFMAQTQMRIVNDPFLTRFYSETYYTHLGMIYIAMTRMVDIIRRHHPTLNAASDVFHSAKCRAT